MKKIFLTLTLSLIAMGAYSSPTSWLSTEGQGEYLRLPDGMSQSLKKASQFTLSPTDGKFHSPRSSANDVALQSALPANGSLYGYLYFSNSDNDPGIYRITPEKIQMLYVDGLYKYGWITPVNGWYSDGKVCGLTMVIDQSDDNIHENIYYELDFDSGEMLTFREFGLSFTNMFYKCALNPENNRIYGYNMDFNTGALYWASAPLSNPTDVTRYMESTSSYCYSLCYNPADGYMYGLNVKQEFVRVAADGTQTVICNNLPESINYYTNPSGITWDPEAECFYACVNLYSGGRIISRIYSITLSGDIELAEGYDRVNQFSFLFTTTDSTSTDHPESPVLDSVFFEDDSLSGKISFTLPTLFLNGEALPETISYTVIIDNESAATGTGAPGEPIIADVSVDTDGLYTFGAYVTANGLNSSRVTSVKYIGKDTPVAPTNVVLTPTKLTWNKVTEGVNGGYVNPAEMTYQVYLNGDLEETTSATYLDLNFDGMELSTYQASVVAVYAGKSSKGGDSNVIVAGDPITPPFYIRPTLEEAQMMTVIDNNRDGYSWTYMEYRECIHMSTNDRGGNDDYVFLPPIKIDDTSMYYSFSLEAANEYVNWTEEQLEVVYASSPTPAGVMGTIIENINPQTSYGYENWDVFQGLWKVPAPGVYYIAIHNINRRNGMGVNVRSFTLTDTDIIASSPASVTGLTVEAAPLGKLEATVSFAFPTKDMDGLALPASTELTAIIVLNDVEVDMEINGKPGEKVSFTLPTLQGNNVIGVTVTDGNSPGPTEYASIYTGVGVPAQPTNIRGTVGADLVTITLEWDPVTTTSMEGAYIDPDDITYLVYVQHSGRGIYYWFPVKEGDFIKETSYTFRLDELYDDIGKISYADAPQDWYNVSVEAFNAAGSMQMVGYPATVYAGVPYPLPYKETFNNPDGTYYNQTKPWTPYQRVGNYTCENTWSVLPSGNGHALSGSAGNSLPSYAAMGMPRFTTKDMDGVTLTMNVRTGNNTPHILVFAEIYDYNELIEIGEIEANSGADGYSEVSFKLPETCLNQYWVQVYYVVEYTDRSQTFSMDMVEVSGKTSGVETNLLDAYAVVGMTGSIHFIGLENEEAAVYSLDGRLVKKCLIDDNDYTLPIDKGIYIVNAGDQRRKVLVK